MKRKTKNILIAVALTVLFTATVAVVYAYLSDQGVKENNFTVGNNTTKIEEDFTPPPEMHEGENPFVKEVRITNTGNVPCYIRVFFDFSDSTIRDSAGISMDSYVKYDDGSDNFDVLTWLTYEQYLANLPDGWVYIPLTGDGGDTLLGGYFYYTKQLPVGESTEYLFKAINAHFETETDVTDFEIVIVSDSVQVTDKNGAEFEDPDAYKKAWTEFLTSADTED